MTKQYFFAFSDGSYSDYGVNGFYVCDHEVTEKEWSEFYGNWLETIAPKIPDWDEWEKREAWRKENDPERLFQKKHGMVKIEYEEFWRDN